MKKFAIAFILFLITPFFLLGEDSKTITVGLWVKAGDSTFNTRIENEITSKLENSNEFPFEVSLKDVNTDFHLNVYGMSIPNIEGYSWSISVVPIFSPQYNTATAATSEASISGMNWTARQSVKFLIEHIYVMKDRVKKKSKDNTQDKT